MGMTKCVSHQEVADWYEAWNRRDWEAVLAFLADHFSLTDMALGREIVGKNEYLKYAQIWAEAFPDGKLKIQHIAGISQTGHLIVVEYTGEGTQTGPWGVFEASNRSTKMSFCDLLTFEECKLASCRTYTDLYRPLCELGHIMSRGIAEKRGERAA